MKVLKRYLLKFVKIIVQKKRKEKKDKEKIKKKEADEKEGNVDSDNILDKGDESASNCKII